MIFWDVTKRLAQRHHSGLLRVGHRLESSLGRIVPDGLRPVAWHPRRRCFHAVEDGKRRAGATFSPDDWLVTPEVFDESEKPGFHDWLAGRSCRCAAVFYDNIPITHPQFTWPRSVSRHPRYLDWVSRVDQVVAISRASAGDLASYWDRVALHPARRPRLSSFRLGADFINAPRHAPPATGSRSQADATLRLLMVGIIEPRKNHDLVLDLWEPLTRAGICAELCICGRVNPHFGKPVLKRIRKLQRAGARIEYLDQPADDVLLQRYRWTDVMLFPSLAEGAGLPVIESLWMGTPVIASDIPPVREYAAGGGCRLFSGNDPDALPDMLIRAAGDPAWLETLHREIRQRPLPTWDDSAREMLSLLNR